MFTVSTRQAKLDIMKAFNVLKDDENFPYLLQTNDDRFSRKIIVLNLEL